MKKKKIRITQVLDLPEDAFDPCPSFLLIGQRECIIDGKCELISYSDEKIVFDIFYKGKRFYISGSELGLSCLSNGNCSVKGTICSVGFEGVK